ncbi:MAG: CorA family divalent cation transporter [Bacillota bacterium]
MELFQLKNGIVSEKIDTKSLEIEHDFIALYSYEEGEVNEPFAVSKQTLEEARYFGYVKYESFETFGTLSIELIDFQALQLAKGSVVVYMERNKCIFFTSQLEVVRGSLEKIFEILGEKITLSRLVYAFFELQTRNSHIVSDGIEKEIMDLEHHLITKNHRNCVAELIKLRKELMVLKRYYEQSLHVLDLIGENENQFFDEGTLRSFKILSRRMERRFHNVLNLREALTHVRETYEAEVDISLNTTMKFFTVVTTIFLPLTLMVGWYGMNLDMPEYDLPYAYEVVSVVSVSFVVVGVLWFKKNKWF